MRLYDFNMFEMINDVRQGGSFSQQLLNIYIDNQMVLMYDNSSTQTNINKDIQNNNIV